MYHEKQQGNYCMKHAINNLIGKELCSNSEFDIYCDELDKLNNFEKGVSKSKLFYNNGGINNIFGYVMTKKNINVEFIYYPYASTNNGIFNTMEMNNLMGFIVYNKQHTYCVRRIDNRYYLIDSMSSRIVEITDRIDQYLCRKNLGLIGVYLKINNGI